MTADTDQYVILVGNAIAALRRRDLDAATKAVEAFGSLEPMGLIGELFLRLDEMRADSDVQNLIDRTSLPLPPRPLATVTAAVNGDTATIAEILGDDFGSLLAGLLALIAALEDAHS